MHTLFLACALIGGAILVIQLALDIFGAGAEMADIDLGGTGTQDGLDLLSVRSVTAGIAFFGIIGLALTTAGMPALVAMAGGLIAGAAAAFGVAALMRTFRRFESDGSIRIHEAIGESGRVYLPIGNDGARPGKVLVTVRGRTQEYLAITNGPALPTGEIVTITGVLNATTVEVASTPALHKEIES